MDINSTPIVDQSLISSIIQSLPPEVWDKFSLVADLSKILVLLAIIYFVILIISKIMKIRDSANISSIAKNVEEINSKLAPKKLKKK